MTEPLRVVCMGGGTGLSSLLSGLKKYAGPFNAPGLDITAIVAVSDDGGSSGRLRREFDVLPPGDIRNCMVALSEDGALLSQLFQYRFEAGHGLKGHSFGNLFLTAMSTVTGDFPEAVKKSCEVLKIAGRIFPATAADVRLEAVLEGGRVVSGETRISKSRQRIREIRMTPPGAKPLKEALEAIERADLITLGPGSLFTSVIPNLLVKGIPQAIRKSGALKAYFVNLMSQPGETIDFCASDHLEEIRRHAGGPLVDFAVLSTTRISPALRRKYAEQNASPVENDLHRLREMGIGVIAADLLQHGPKVRHNPEATAAVAMDLARRGRRRRRAKKLPAAKLVLE